MTQKLWRHAVTADGTYEGKKKDRKGGIAYKRRRPF